MVAMTAAQRHVVVRLANDPRQCALAVAPIATSGLCRSPLKRLDIRQRQRIEDKYLDARPSLWEDSVNGDPRIQLNWPLKL